MAKYSFLKIGYLANLIVTDDRETAKSCIEQGYTLLTVPQMFGMEDGVIVLAWPVPNQKSGPMSAADALRVLTDQETASRENYSSQFARSGQERRRQPQ